MDRPKFTSKRDGKSVTQGRREGSSGLIGTDDPGCRHFAVHRLEELDLAQRSDQFGKLASVTVDCPKSPVFNCYFVAGSVATKGFGRSMGG